MIALGLILILVPLLLTGYAYGVYPALVWLVGRRKPARTVQPDPASWPRISLCLPVYNEERVLDATLRSLLELDYPRDRVQILVISDCSSDRTDEIALQYADQGVELVRLPERRGKTAAENEAAHHARGDIVVNTDATTRIDRDGLKALARAFGDPTVGVASGRDVSVTVDGVRASGGESRYVGYEMWVRDLETRAGTIVGASGCFFGIRRQLFRYLVPEALSRDFASPLIAREHGFRSVSVPEALCYIPRARSMKVEFRRKTRTMARGLETLWFKRSLLNPFRYGAFALMLASHKLVRWLAFLLAPLAVAGVVLIAVAWEPLQWAAGVAVLGFLLGLGAFSLSDRLALPRPVAFLAFAAMSTVAAWKAWGLALSAERNPIWEPTRR